MTNQYKYINPSELKLIVLTSCNCDLNSHVNISSIFNQIEHDDNIINVILGDECRGKIKELKKKLKKKKNSKKNQKKKHFVNQITIIVSYLNNFINIKLFGNGKMVITGAKSVDTIKIMIMILLNKIRNLKDRCKIDTNRDITQLFCSSVEFSKFLEKNHLLLLQLINLHDLYMPINWHNILVNKYKNDIDYSNNSILDYIKKYVFIDNSNFDQNLLNLTKLTQLISIVKKYSYQTIKNTKCLNDIQELFNGNYCDLPVSYDTLPSNLDEISVIVNNYNAMFESNIKIDRGKLYEILTNKYNIAVNYRPSSYQGLNITDYIDDKKITFFAFQDGTIMITGNKNWDCIMRGYSKICQLLDDNYNDIISLNTIVADKKKIVNVAKFEQTVDGEVTVYLSKQVFIMNNPRNYYALKINNLLDYYINNK